MIPFWKKTGKHSKPQSAQKRGQNAKPAVPRTAQQSIPMQRMFEDGTCRVKANYYTRTIQYQDINYQLAQQEDKTAIFEEWCSFLNFFDMPILEDLYNALLQQDEKEAHHVATALEIYVKGSLNLFNHRTNVNVNNRIVCYDIKELGKQMKKLGMLIVQDQVWGRVTANRSSGKSTRYYMDEMHLLLKEEQTAAYSVEIWKRFRKWGGIPTGLTQNVKDLLSSREVENIFENSDMIIMLNQAAGDRQILAKQLNISPHQLSYVTHSGEGEGLLFFGNVILPFVDRFPTDLELYRIMTTKLGEVSEGAQK